MAITYYDSAFASTATELRRRAAILIEYQVRLENQSFSGAGAAGEVISVADEHYFLVDAGCERWVSVHDLKPGSILKSLSGPVGVTGVFKRGVPLSGKVYNLKIKDSERYLVGWSGVIVRDY